MDFTKKKVTLISKDQAKIGLNFTLIAIPDECKSCRFYNVCIGNIKVGRRYRIVDVKRDRYVIYGKCKLTGCEVIPVIVEELPLIAILPHKLCIEGLTLTLSQIYSQVPKFCLDILRRDLIELIKGCLNVKVKIVRVLDDEVKCFNSSYRLVLIQPYD